MREEERRWVAVRLLVALIITCLLNNSKIRAVISAEHVVISPAITAVCSSSSSSSDADEYST